MLIPDQSLSIPKAQFTALTAWGQRWLDCTEQLAKLQLRTGRAALTDYAVFARELLDARSPEHLLSACQAAAAPMAEKAEAYCRSLYEIASSASASWSRLASEQTVEFQQQLGTALEGVHQNLPQDFSSAASLFRQTIASATAGMESVHKAAMQAAEVTDANVKAMARSGNRKAPGAAD